MKGWKLRMEAQGRAERALERAMAPSAAAAESEASARAKDGAEEAGAGTERREAVGADQQQDVEPDASVRDGQDMRSPLPRCLTALRQALVAMAGGCGRGAEPRQ